jgi:hypothetical protein
MRLHLGGEWQPIRLFSLRGGFMQTPNQGSNAGLTVGCGLLFAFSDKMDEPTPDADRLKPFWQRSQDFSASEEGSYLVGLDYAFETTGDLGDVQRVSLSVRFK